MNGNVEALAVVVVGSLPVLAGAVELVGVLDVLDGDTPPFAVDVGSVFVVGVVSVFVVDVGSVFAAVVGGVVVVVVFGGATGWV